VYRHAGASRHANEASRARRRARISLGGAVALSASVLVGSVTAGAAPATQRLAGAAAGRPTPCTSQQLGTRFETSPGFVASASREAVATVLLVNNGRASCTIEGWPRLWLIAPSGAARRAVQLDSVNGAFGEVEPTRVTLRPDGKAAFFVAAPPVARCEKPFGLSVAGSAAVAPGPETALDVAASGMRICSAGARIEVSAIHPATVHLFEDYPGRAGPLDPAALQRPSFPACRTRDLHELRSTLEQPRAGGNEEVEVFIRNAAASCSLRSRWPVVSLTANNAVLVTAVREEALLPADVGRFGGSQSPPRYVNLGRDAVALFDILVRTPVTAASCRRARGIEVRFDVTPGQRLAQAAADSYRPAIGIPSCEGEETLAVNPSVAVTPITAVPDFAHPLAKAPDTVGAVAPTNDRAGFGWGGDSSGGVCTGGTYPYGVEGLAKYGLVGPCAGYFGQVGAAWSQWPGCPDSGWGWNSTDAAEAAANYPKYGIGNAFIYFTGGAGMMPPGVTSVKTWADMQMVNFAAQAAKAPYSAYADEPVVILDVETGYGWNDTVTDPTSGTFGCAFPHVVSGNYKPAANRALLAEMVAKAATVFPGYEVVVYTGGKLDWNPWFSTEAWTGSEYTFVYGIPGTPDFSVGNEPGRFCLRGKTSPCAQFWGRQSSGSAGAVLWQFASPVAPSTASMDIDQIDFSRFPVHP
jgi:hypothetical protein